MAYQIEIKKLSLERVIKKKPSMNFCPPVRFLVKQNSFRGNEENSKGEVWREGKTGG